MRSGILEAADFPTTQEQQYVVDELNGRSDADVKEPDLLRALWVFFSSMKTAIALLLLLAVGSVIGTVIPQDSPPEMYIRQYGQAKSSIILKLGLHDVFHSSWYSFLLTMMSVNLLVCSINRFKLAWRRAYQPKVLASSDQITGMQVSDRVEFTDGSVEDAESKVVTALGGARYSVSTDRDGGDVCVYAAKGRMGIWGPYLTHLSLLIIFAGYILGNRIGFDGYAFIPEGSKVTGYYPKDSEQIRDLGFEVRLVDFTIELDEKRNVSGYKSHLQVFDGGKQVAEKTIDVNHPLTYRGATFYQSDFGLEGMIIKVTRPDGSPERVPIRLQTQAGPHGKEYVPELVPVDVKTGGKTWAFFVHHFAPDYVDSPAVNASDLPINPAALVYVNERFAEDPTAWRKIGWVSRDTPAEYKGHKIELEDVIDYTGLQVAGNPALPVVYAGFAIMLLGVFASFYIHHRVVRVRISPSEGMIAVGGASRADASVVERDIARLREALGR